MIEFDCRLALACGTDIPVVSCGVVLHQPFIKEIALIGEKVFFTGVQCLTINKSMFGQDKNGLDITSNFQIFMMIMLDKGANDKKSDTLSVLQLLFPDYKVSLTPNSILFIKDKETIIIDGNNFDDLQEIIRLIFCLKTEPMDQQSFNPANEKAKEIAQKLMRGRERVAAQKGGSSHSIFGQYLSVLSIGLQMPLQKLAGLTMFQLYDLVERFYLYLNWDIDVRSKLAGAKSEKPVENWMKNLH